MRRSGGSGGHIGAVQLADQGVELLAASSAFAAGSSDTVTLVSEVETRSIDSPWSLNTANASAMGT